MVKKSKLRPEQKRQCTKKQLMDLNTMFREHHRNMRALGYVPPSLDEMERVNRIIAGEE